MEERLGDIELKFNAQIVSALRATIAAAVCKVHGQMQRQWDAARFALQILRERTQSFLALSQERQLAACLVAVTLTVIVIPGTKWRGL